MPDNPYAFPQPMVVRDGGIYAADEYATGYGGMELRDYFAAKAMHAELVTAGALPDPARSLREAAQEAGQSIVERIAFLSYQLADAMLAAREKKPEAPDAVS
jgi:hypothetical protein